MEEEKRRSVKELIERKRELAARADSISRMYHDKEAELWLQLKPLEKRMKKAAEESQQASMDIWYVFGLRHADGSEGLPGYSDEEKELARIHYYGRR